MSTAEVKRLHDKVKASKALVTLSVFMALLIAVVISISVGAGSPGFVDAAQIILSRIFPFLDINSGSKVAQIIILDVRLPRIVLAIIAGVGLAASGTAMQGVLRNPLVSPYTLGISWAAGFGAALAIGLGIGVFIHSGPYFLVANAFIFSLLAMLTVYGIAHLRGITPETIILAGIAISHLFLALLSLIQYIAPERAAQGIIFWLLGRFSNARWESILIIFPIVMVAIILMIRHSWDMNVMSLGEETAMSLGVNSKRVLVICMVLGSLATASIISFIGVIGFIGLVSPHIARMLVGSDHRFLFPCSIASGACLLLCSDTLARLVLMPSEMPVGIVTFLIGVPFFLYLLLRKRSPLWH